jgi:hypothetical protein
MNRFLSSLLLLIGLFVSTYPVKASGLRTRVTDDSQTLTIQIDGQKNGRIIYLNQRYDVTGLNTVQKEILMFRAFKSVGLVLPLHEMPALIFGSLALIIFVSTLLIMRYQASKALLPQHTVTHLRA